MRRPATLAAIGLAATTLSACGGGQDAPTRSIPDTTVTAAATAGAAEPAADAIFSGGTVSPVKPAPELGLTTWDGKRKRIGHYRGDATLVTFVYTRCPDICPLIIDNLLRVRDRLGPDAARLRIVAVSVDPDGDTRGAVKRFLTAHRAVGKVDYLIGTRPQLEATWARWGVGARVDPTNPSLVEHSGVIWGVDPKGRRVTFYPASGFDAADIESDIRAMLGN